MQLENILIEKKGHVAVATINHPPANTWNLATVQDFEKAIDFLENDRETRVVIITGSGDKCFSAGYDVSDSANANVSSPMTRALWRRIDRMEKPTIAAMNGHAMGGGLELSLCCHFRVAADNPKIKFGLSELNLGIIPGWGGTQRLPRVVGKAKALDMILFSRILNPQQALEIGLVNQLAAPDKLLETAMELAEKLAARPPVAVKWVLKAMAAGDYESLDAGLDTEANGSLAVRESKDGAEGFKAFMEKRAPVFTGE